MIQGTVMDGSTGKALPGVEIFAVDGKCMPIRLPGTTSGSDGSFTFPFELTGDPAIRVKFIKDGYCPVFKMPGEGSGNITLAPKALLQPRTLIYIGVAMIAYSVTMYFLLHKSKPNL